MFWLYLSIIIFIIVSFSIFLYVILKRFYQPIIIEKIIERPTEKFSNFSMERAIREGMKSAIKELESEKIVKEEMEERLKNSNKNMGVYVSTDESDYPVKRSGGNLVPFNLTEDEKKVLEMFYHD